MKVNEVVKELRALSTEELETKIVENKKELFEIKTSNGFIRKTI